MLATILAAAVVVTAVPLSGIGVMAEENGGKDEFATEITDEFESELLSSGRENPANYHIIGGAF